MSRMWYEQFASTLMFPGKSVQRKIFFLISQPKHNFYVVGTQKNRLIETVLLSTQDIFLNLQITK